MVRLAGINIPNNKHLFVALTYIYGIGSSLSYKVCFVCKLDPYKKMGSLTNKEIDCLRNEIGKINIEGDLRRETSTNIKRLIDLNSYHGKRHRRRLPVRGQRTRTNAKTCKKSRKK